MFKKIFTALALFAGVAVCSAQATTYQIAASPAHPFYFGKASTTSIYAYGIPVIEQGQTQPTGSFWIDTDYQSFNGYIPESFLAWLNFNFPTATTQVLEITKVGGTGTCSTTIPACLPTQVTVPFIGTDANGNPYSGTVVLVLSYYYSNSRYSGWYGKIVGGSVTISEPL